MSDDLRHEEIEAMVAPWALGALDEAEAEQVRAHVEGCAECREVASRLRRVAGVLPLTVDEIAPPARLRERVLAAAQASSPQAAPLATRVRRPPPRRGIPAPRMPTYALAAVAVVALLIGVLIGDVALHSQQPDQQVTRFALRGQGEMATASATVVDLKSDGVALINFRGLPAPGANRLYQVWLVPEKGHPVPVAVFAPDSRGAGIVVVDHPLAGFAVMAVTNEPAPDGSPAPTQQPQLSGNVV